MTESHSTATSGEVIDVTETVMNLYVVQRVCAAASTPAGLVIYP